MQTSFAKSKIHNFLLMSLLANAAALVISNLFGKETATPVSLLIYVIVSGSLLVLSIIIASRFGTKGDHGKAWLLFAVFATMWFVAERIVMVYNLTTGKEPFPSEADLFWIAGYPFLFSFSLIYLKPVKKAISTKLLIVATLTSLGLLSGSLLFSYDEMIGQNLYEVGVGVGYIVGDSIILVPAIIGVVLFFRGKVNFLWSLICVGMLLQISADTAFLLATVEDSYYQGHIVDLLYTWSYIMFSFGVYSHLRIFTHYKKKFLDDAEKLK